MAETLEALRARRAPLEEIVAAKFSGLTDEQLIGRILRAPDFGWDDEGVELTRRADARGEGWRFVEGPRGSSRVIFFRKADALALDITMGGFAGIVWGYVLSPEEGRENAAKFLRLGYITQAQHDDAIRRVAEWELTRKEATHGMDSH